MNHELRTRLIACDLTAYEMTIVDTLLAHFRNGAAELDVESAVPHVRDVYMVIQTIMGKLE